MRSLEQKKAYDKAYYLANKEKIIARSAAHHKANRRHCSDRQKLHYHRVAKWKKVPGWTKDMYETKLIEQKGLCAICQKLMSKPVRDHDHATGLSRGLLCDPCNRLLGCVQDCAQPLLNAALYLFDHHQERGKLCKDL